MAAAHHVLLAQADTAQLASLAANLEVAGFRVTEVTTGDLALSVARSERPDLIVLDLVLPCFDGWWALGELKAESSLSAIPVLILTASAEERNELLARERGGLAFLSKPIPVEDFVAAVQQSLLSVERTRATREPDDQFGKAPCSSISAYIARAYVQGDRVYRPMRTNTRRFCRLLLSVASVVPASTLKFRPAMQARLPAKPDPTTVATYHGERVALSAPQSWRRARERRRKLCLSRSPQICRQAPVRS